MIEYETDANLVAVDHNVKKITFICLCFFFKFNTICLFLCVTPESPNFGGKKKKAPVEQRRTDESTSDL